MKTNLINTSLLVTYIIYVISIYSFMWIKVDNIKGLKNATVYSDNIKSLNCSQGKPGRVFLSIYLNSGDNLKFKYRNAISCDEFNQQVPNPKGKNFNATFIGSTVIQMFINEKHLVQFPEEKKRLNIFTFYLIIFPLIASILVYFIKQFRKSMKY